MAHALLLALALLGAGAPSDAPIDASDSRIFEQQLRDMGLLTYSAGGVMTGASRATLRNWIDLVEQSSRHLARQAMTDKLTKDTKQPLKR